MNEKNGSSSSKFKAVLTYIGLCISLWFVLLYLIPHLLNKDLGEMDTYIAQSVKDLESGINMNSLVGDWKVYDYGQYRGNVISCKVQGSDIRFSEKTIDKEHKKFMMAFSSTSFNLISEDPLIFEGAVLEERAVLEESESKRTKLRLTFDGETRLTITYWDDDSGEWSNITSKLYFEKF